ncbi:protein-methionine sulfoxide oxidase mical3b-like isoform X5 [Ostrea edulis]|uniref:protein-methionine sulfoxide oxidase mical3b-like isoform X5 n=1 Tax=Ostrea edulis TaxID=37623 RepID=UPI0024AFEAD9|nr:protein-methionine sulfoxide oxidase mical3b-like isoform X5 [Ostrea edulis]
MGSHGNKGADLIFDQFLKAGTCKSVLGSFHQLCESLELKHTNHRLFYRRLSNQLTSWKAQTVWVKLNKRMAQKEYRKGEACANTRVLVIGAGPCGLRTAIEAAFLGCKVVLVEKRDSFSRNNVLHLWPFLITDLKNLGAKKFFGKFCAGAIDHISIRQLQCILMKVALLVGVEIHVNVSFDGLIEPTEEQSNVGWRFACTPNDHVVSEYEFDVLIGADGKRNTLQGFRRKEFRGKLAIAITANFINRNTTEEAKVEEISGVAFIFNQKFFKDLNEKTGIDLENIVYYKDDTHYFVMTAKKTSLLDKGVLRDDRADTAMLLSPDNIDRDALLEYAKEAADFSTNFAMPNLEYAINHYGQPDVAMFDFTSMFASVTASRVIDRHGHRLLMGLVGDSLLEPFWPTGSGCARGFLGGFDAAWMIRSWASGKMTPLQVIAERESIYQLLSQTTPENLNKNYNEYTIDPNTRYPNLNTKLLRVEQVRHLYDCGDQSYEDGIFDHPAKRLRSEECIDSYTLLHWCQRVLNNKFRNVHIIDLTTSWRSGLALCALIHTFKPSLIDFNSLSSLDVIKNNQLAFDVANTELGISPVMTGQEMGTCSSPDKLTMVSYLSEFYHKFHKERYPSVDAPVRRESHKSPLHRSLLQKIRNSAKLSRSKRNSKREEEKNEHNMSLSRKKYREEIKQQNGNVHLTRYNKLPMEEITSKLTVDKKEEVKLNNDPQSNVKVSQMAEILVSKFKQGLEPPVKQRIKTTGVLLAAQPESEFCYFCKKRVYIMERMCAESVFFHRGCLKCDFCECGLRVNNYACERVPGGEVKFYCFRHSKPEMRLGRAKRKREYEEDPPKESIPKIVEDGDKTSGKETSSDSPKKIPAPLTPPLAPNAEYVKAKKTPERIEFENSIDGLPEESEEELTEHNLRASLSRDAMLEEMYEEDLSDSDLDDLELAAILQAWSSDDDEIQEAVESTYGHNVNKDLTLEEALAVVETLKRKSYESLIDAVKQEGGEESEDDTDTEYEASEADSEVEEMEYEDSSPDKPTKDFVTEESLVQTSSPQRKARANFFTSPPEPVRLDPWKMFEKTPEREIKKKTQKEVVVNGEEDEEELLVREEEDEEELLEAGGEELVLNKEEDVEEELEGDERGEEVEDDDEIEDSEEEGEEEEDDDKTAMSRQMQMILEDIDQKSSVSDSADVLRSSVSDTGEARSVISDADQSADEEDVFTGEDTQRAVLQSVKNVSSSNSNSSQSTREAVLNSVRNMQDSDQNEDKDFLNVDDRFITKGRGSAKKKRCVQHRNSFGSDSSFTISTPSDSLCSSISSLAADIEMAENDVESPDKDMIRDYCLTLSHALGESFDDDDEKLDDIPQSYEDTPRTIGREEVSPRENLDDTLIDEEADLHSNGRKSSVYGTPNASVADERYFSISDHESSHTSNITSAISSAGVSGTSSGDARTSSTDYQVSSASTPSSTSDNQELTDKNSNVVTAEPGAAKLNSDGTPWRALPPLPILASTSNFEKSCSDKSKIMKKEKSMDKIEGNRKLPDISNLKSNVTQREFQSNVTQREFQSNFMRQHLGSPRSEGVSAEKSCSNDSGRKTKISVDHAKLKSMSSLEDSSSQGEEKSKKKIAVDVKLREHIKTEPVVSKPGVIGKGSHIDDIPFVDDSDEEVVQEKFFTPATSKKKEPVREEGAGKGVKKRLLPLPPRDIPGVNHTEMGYTREKARQRARMKSDEELGIKSVEYTPKVRGLLKRSTSNTPSTSDFVSDSDDPSKVLHSTPVEKAEAPKPDFKSSGKTKKSKKKSMDLDLTLSEKSDGDTSKEKVKKKKSLLQILKPGKDKSPKELKDRRSSSNDTLDEKSPKKKTKTPKSDKKKKKKMKSASALEDLDKDLSELNLQGVKERFTSEKRPGPSRRYAVRKPMPPKAELEEFSDSDDSRMDTLKRARDRRTMSEDELNYRIARRVQSAARKHMKQQEQKRLRMAQEIQRQLEEVDVKQKELEERGVIVERALRGEGPDAGRVEAELMQEWFTLVYEKNALVRYESELMVNAQYMELEDRHGRLEQELREKMSIEIIDFDYDSEKTPEQAGEEKRILDELLEVVEERDKLVAMLEEERVREREEDRDLEAIMNAKGYSLVPTDYAQKIKYSSRLFPLSC